MYVAIFSSAIGKIFIDLGNEFSVDSSWKAALTKRLIEMVSIRFQNVIENFMGIKTEKEKVLSLI
jgi:hypothetical protein